jgi:hypothetical protein
VGTLRTGDRIKEYTIEANRKLNGPYTGTKQAIHLIAGEKAGEFMVAGDIGLSREEKALLIGFIAGGMMQSFSLGYGVGKVEGETRKQIHL